jgi:hypothetical protein
MLWDILLYDILSRISVCRTQISRLVESSPRTDPDSFSLSPEMKKFRSEIARRENASIRIAVSNSITLLTWTTIELALVATCKKLDEKRRLGRSVRIPTRRRLATMLRMLESYGIQPDPEPKGNLLSLETVRECIAYVSGMIAQSREPSRLQVLTSHSSWLSVLTDSPYDELIVIVDHDLLILLL